MRYYGYYVLLQMIVEEMNILTTFYPNTTLANDKHMTIVNKSFPICYFHKSSYNDHREFLSSMSPFHMLPPYSVSFATCGAIASFILIYQ